MVGRAIEQEKPPVLGIEGTIPPLFPKPNTPFSESLKPFSLISRKLGDLAISITDKLSFQAKLFTNVTINRLANKVSRRGSRRFGRGRRPRCARCHDKHSSFENQCAGFSKPVQTLSYFCFGERS